MQLQCRLLLRVDLQTFDETLQVKSQLRQCELEAENGAVLHE